MNPNQLRETPSAAFIPQQTVTAVRGDLARAGDLYRVRFERTAGKESVTYYYDFGNHPLRELIPTYLFEGTGELTGGTINTRCNSLRVLNEYLTSAGETDLTPGVCKKYVGWLSRVKNSRGRPRFSAFVVSEHALKAQQLYACGLTCEYPLFNQRDFDAIREISAKMLRGNRKRGVQKSVDQAISADTYFNLLRAISLEFRQCERVREAVDAGERPYLYDCSASGLKRLDPNPYVVLTLMAALRHGIRASEVNAFNRGDLRIDPEGGEHELYVHAPDKSDDYVPVDNMFVLAWQLCDMWSKEARALIGLRKPREEDPLLVYLSTATNHPEALVQLTTDHLNEILLPYFYRKWFDHRVTDMDGRECPLLHADGVPSRPFWCSYRKLRNSFAVRFADRERNRSVMRGVMRHTDIRTTERYYLQQTRLDYAKKVQIALKAEVQTLVMLMKNAALADLSPESLRKAEDKGAVLPHGLCGSAMEGEGCVQAGDCLECPHLVVLASRKPRFEADRDEYLRRAELLHLEGDCRGAENALGRAKACQAQIIRIEDTFEGGAR